MPRRNPDDEAQREARVERRRGEEEKRAAAVALAGMLVDAELDIADLDGTSRKSARERAIKVGVDTLKPFAIRREEIEEYCRRFRI